jgi:hypothetical protein
MGSAAKAAHAEMSVLATTSDGARMKINSVKFVRDFRPGYYIRIG